MSPGGERPEASAALPRISPYVSRWFDGYLRRYLRRHFHAVRLLGAERVAEIGERPVIVFLNHPSWWDPLVCLWVARRLWPDRGHFGPIDSAMLERYGIFRRLGFFGVEPGTARGARALLRQGRAICEAPRTTLWITPQGRFQDPRVRPVTLEGGLGWLVAHLARRAATAETACLPFAIEYPFVEERQPEVAVALGETVTVGAMKGLDHDAISTRLAARLEACQDELAGRVTRREREAFRLLLSGRGGVGFVYDAWRRLRARLTGRQYSEHHGESE